MKIFPKPAEEALAKTARELQAKHQGYCIHFHLSALQPEYKKENNLTPLRNALQEVLKKDTDGIFLCSDFDLFVITSTADARHIAKTISQVRFLYADDPLAYGTEKEGAAQLATVYDLAEDYEGFFFACTRKLAAYKERMQKTESALEEDKPSRITLREAWQKTPAALWQKALQERRRHTQPSFLIIEDQVFSQQLLRAALAQNYISHAAKDAVEGVMLYARYAPDIVFLDIELPDYDGHQVLHLLLQQDPEAFIVMTTANNNAGDVKRAIQEGAKGYIVKPFTKQKIEQYIQLYRTRTSST